MDAGVEAEEKDLKDVVEVEEPVRQVTQMEMDTEGMV